MFTHPANAEEPILTTLSGRVNPDIPSLRNAPTPIVRRPSGRETLVILEQPPKHQFITAVVPSGISNDVTSSPLSRSLREYFKGFDTSLPNEIPHQAVKSSVATDTSPVQPLKAFEPMSKPPPTGRPEREMFRTQPQSSPALTLPSFEYVHLNVWVPALKPIE